MNIEHALIELAHSAPAAASYAEMLALLCSVFEAEVGVVIAIEEGRERRAIRGLGERHEACLDAVWKTARREMAPVKREALRAGAATDHGVLGAKLASTTVFRHVMAPVGGTETLFVVPTQGESALGMWLFGRCRGRFSTASIAHAKSLVPALSVVSRAMYSSSAPLPPLTAIDLDLLDYLELGYGTQQIAVARGTSFFTVRNQLSALYRKLEVSNRAEAIGVRRGGRKTR